MTLALAGLWLAGCGPRVVPSTIACTSDQDCTGAARCQQGVCQAGDDDAGAPLSDAGARDAGEAPLDAGRDAGKRDGGDGDVDAGPAADAGARDAAVLDAGPEDAAVSPVDAGDDGGACAGGCPAPLQRAPLEVCGDGYDNDCDGLVDEQPCGQMRSITISASALPAGYSLMIPVSAALLDGSDGSDVRVWRAVPAANDVSFVELHRVLDPDESWSDPHTLWFALPGALTAQSAGEYRLTWGAQPSAELVGAPLADEQQVFHFADYFELPSEDGSAPWSVTDNDGNEDIEVSDGALTFVAANEMDGKPYATADFSPLAGRFLFDVRFHWEGSDGNDTEDYAWRLVLGDSGMGSAAPTNDELEPAGVGPNLLWSGGMPSFPMPFHHALAVDGQPADSDAEEGIRVLGSAGITSARVIIEGSTSTGTFQVSVNGQPYPAAGVFHFADPTLTLLNRLRVYTAELTISEGEGFSRARFEHMILRPRAATEPSLSLSQHAPCP